ncbi:MAG: lysophospholipid acyltransferase family protein [Deltaproteobacteria bacterium]
MIRSVLLLIIGVIFTAFMSGCAVLFPLISPGENKAHRVASIWARILLILSNTRVKVIGTENVLAGRPQIFMANHQSDFDILIVLAHIPGQFRWIVKKELFNIPVFGAAMRNAGYIEIDRQNHERAMMSIDKAARKITEGKSMMSFPEGTRSRDGSIRPFKKGMFHLAIKSGVPIVPISIVGAKDIMPKRSLHIKPGQVTLVIDKPIDVSGYEIENRNELIERVRNVIVGNCETYENL